MGTLTVDPKDTEQFLLAQEDVLDASVWIDGGLLRAHVTLATGARVNELLLQRACQNQLGLMQTPQKIEVIAPMRAG